MNRILIPRRSLTTSSVLSWRNRRGRTSIAGYGPMHFVKDVDTMLKNPFEGSKAKYRIIGSFGRDLIITKLNIVRNHSLLIQKKVVFVIVINGILMALEDNYGISKRSNAQLMDFYPERMGERYVYEEKNNRRLGDLQAHELVRLENDAKENGFKLNEACSKKIIMKCVNETWLAIIDIKRKMIAESEASKE